MTSVIALVAARVDKPKKITSKGKVCKGFSLAINKVKSVLLKLKYGRKTSKL